MTPTKMFEVYRKGLFFNYQIISTRFYNEALEMLVDFEESDYVFIQFNKKWFERDNMYYDGITSRSITLLGICVGYGHNYQWEEVKNS